MKTDKKICVVIPVYGEFDIERAVISTRSILFQKMVDLEIIVSEQGETPKFPKMDNVLHIYSYHKPNPNLSDYNPGRIRNIAINAASCEYVYTNDADIVFSGPYFLANSLDELSKNPKLVFKRPYMRRLPIDQFPEFASRTNNYGIKYAIRSLDFSQNFIATTDGKIKRLRTFEKSCDYQKTFTAFEEDYQSYYNAEINQATHAELYQTVDLYEGQ